jgi:hypothetical protein
MRVFPYFVIIQFKIKFDLLLILFFNVIYIFGILVLLLHAHTEIFVNIYSICLYVLYVRE